MTGSRYYPILLPQGRMERLSGWGKSVHALSYVYRPSTIDGIREAFALGRERKIPIALRGAGRSYGDAALGGENIVLDLTRMNRILQWDAERGVIVCEPGVTIRQLWQYALGDGWWPYVVSGTMFPTVGGAAAMNIHGKNNFAVGTIGDHIRAFDLLLPSGEIVTCNRAENAELFHAAIGGFGVLGVFTSLTLELKRVHSGNLRVTPLVVRNWREMFALFEERIPQSDYLVGWVDCFASGPGAGRGQIHQANYLAEGEDHHAAQTLRVESQELPDTLFGIFPKSAMWRLMRPFFNNLGIRMVNAAKYYASVRSHGHVHLQSHAAFAFLLDYVPNWKKSYGPGGLIQYQSFVPKENAEATFAAQIALCQKRGLVPYLGVFKRHRPDPFLMTHSVDGYSLALDFKVTERNRPRLWSLTAELDSLVLNAGGRFYFAKDSTLHHSRIADYLGEDRVQRFLELKRQCDPENLLQTDLYRRVFGSEVHDRASRTAGSLYWSSLSK